MGTPQDPLLRSTVLRELLLAFVGMGLAFFIVAHLAGNLLIYAGPGVFNAYAEHLQYFRPFLWTMRVSMITFFGLHVVIATTLWLRNRAARKRRYAVTAYRSFKGVGTRTMIITGAMILAFLFLHLNDFTLADKAGPRALVNGENLGLYGIVWNGFSNPVRALAYVVFVCCVGLHLSHAISSVCVTLGVENDRLVRRVDFVARAAGAFVALGYSSIPVYVLLNAHMPA